MLTKNENKKEILRAFVLPPVLGALCFIFLYGIRILNPMYDSWLLAGGDLSQHYIGWEGYRNSGWTFPFGLSDSLTYPTSISVIFTDSIPLLAVFFKLLSPVLPRTFQYWGLWGLIGFMLTALSSVWLLRKYSPSLSCTLIASLFFILSPTIVQRLYGHESLGGGQWLVIASLLPLAYYEERYSNARRAAVFWGLLAFFCVGIHIYFSVTCFFALLAFCAYGFMRGSGRKSALASMASFCLVSVIATWLLGGLKGGIRGKGAGEVGEFSANLNSLLNPLEYSRIFPALPTHGIGQHEGFSYLGMGILLLLATTLVLLALRGKALPPVLHDRKKACAFALAAAMSFIFALSPVVTFGSHLLVSVPVPHVVSKLLVTFRSTGRMIWLCFYIIYFAAICLFVRTGLRPQVRLCVLAACLLLHVLDFSGLYAGRHSRYASPQEYENQFFASPAMRELSRDGRTRHLCIASPLESEELFEVAQFAMENGMTVNRFWTVHQIGRADEEELLKESLSDPQEGTAFLFKKEDSGLCGIYGLEQVLINDSYVLGLPGMAGRQ